MKKIICSMLTVLLILNLTACKKQTDAQKFKEEYESLNGTIREKDGQEIRSIEIDKDNPFVYATAEEIVEKINNKETFAVYFGFSDCPWCRSVLPSIIEVAQETDTKVIYYVDIKEIRDTLEVDSDGNITTTKEGTEGYMSLLEKLDSVLADYTLKDTDGNEVETNEKRIYAPNLVSIVKGVPEELSSVTSSLQTNGYMELTDEMKTEMKANARCVLGCLKENTNICTNAC
jgi:predicted bacteriocin transport accessory protein